jgi:surfactin synthase thioesterase subunit
MRGGHLFLQQQRDALLACIRADLALVEPEAVQQMGQR